MEDLPLLELNNIWKKFDDNTVLKGVNSAVSRGKIHALVGGNGAGKSTLMKIITGLYQHDLGELIVKGKPVKFSNPSEAHKEGIYLVPQEPLIFPNMSVEENILIGVSRPKKELKERVLELVDSLGWNLDLTRIASSLSIAEQQLVELLRGLVRDADILILDEPTSTLTPHEIQSLFFALNKLAKRGKGLIYITHRLSEIFQIADEVTVIRDGKISAAGPVHTFTYEKLVQSLLPESAERNSVQYPHRTDTIQGEIALELIGISGKRFHDISFSVKKGEVKGIAGIVGAGRTELAEAIFGLSSIEKGEILLDGEPITKQSLQNRLSKGIVYVPEDRHAHGLFSTAALKNNISSAILNRMKGLFLPQQQEQDVTQSYISKLSIKTESTAQAIGSLSGGNQQKAVLAKYLATEPKVILFDEPTRGIDARARLDIYQIINELKMKGIGILLISSDFEEIIHVCDEVLIMHEGELTAKFTGKEISIDDITTASYGFRKEAQTCHAENFPNP